MVIGMVYSLLIITASYYKKRSIPCRKFTKNLLKLARNLLLKNCANLVDFIRKMVHQTNAYLVR